MEQPAYPEQYHLFPRLARLGHFILDQMHYEPVEKEVLQESIEV